MATYTCEAIILRRTNFGEADRLVTLFSDRHGKIRALAKGVRRPTAKMAGSVEMLSQAKLRLAEGKNLDIIVESNPLNHWQGIRENLNRMHLASYLVEIVDKTTQENESHPAVYRLLLELLEYVDSANDVASAVAVDYFRLRLMKDLGYEPSVHGCAVGHEPLKVGANSWSSSAGGVVCDEHRSQTERAVVIADNTIKLIRLMLNRGLAQVAQIEVPTEINNQLHRIIDDFFDYHFDVTIKSERYVELA